MLMLGAGMGVVFVPLTTASLSGVRPEDSGAASSMVNVMQQVGGAVGLAVLVAVYGTAYRDAARHPLRGASAVAEAHHLQSHGTATAFLLAAIFDVVSLIVIATLIRTRTPAIPPPAPAEAEEEAMAT
jgi:hypothetical protein